MAGCASSTATVTASVACATPVPRTAARCSRCVGSFPSSLAHSFLARSWGEPNHENPDQRLIPSRKLQWLPATIYPNLIASLGFEGCFRLWAEDPSAPPGRRFSSGRSAGRGPRAFDTRSSHAPYRSFSMKHNEDSGHSYLALLAADGRLTVYENEQPEILSEFASMDEFTVCPKPSRGEEVSFRVRFDPNPEPCYVTLRAGVPPDALGLVVAAMSSVKVYRSRDVTVASYGLSSTQKEFYLALDIQGHRGLVRDIAWAPGNIRGYIIATACQDGYARVFRVDTPYSPDDNKTWSAADLLKPADKSGKDGTGGGDDASTKQPSHPSTLSASLAKSGAHVTRHWSGQPGQIPHTCREISRLDNHRTPVWRIGFDDDGQILGSTGDGKLLCYRQTPNGAWAKSSELAMVRSGVADP